MSICVTSKKPANQSAFLHPCGTLRREQSGSPSRGCEKASTEALLAKLEWADQRLGQRKRRREGALSSLDVSPTVGAIDRRDLHDHVGPKDFSAECRDFLVTFAHREVLVPSEVYGFSLIGGSDLEHGHEGALSFLQDVQVVELRGHVGLELLERGGAFAEDGGRGMVSFLVQAKAVPRGACASLAQGFLDGIVSLAWGHGRWGASFPAPLPLLGGRLGGRRVGLGRLARLLRLREGVLEGGALGHGREQGVGRGRGHRGVAVPVLVDLPRLDEGGPHGRAGEQLEVAADAAPERLAGLVGRDALRLRDARGEVGDGDVGGGLTGHGGSLRGSRPSRLLRDFWVGGNDQHAHMLSHGAPHVNVPCHNDDQGYVPRFCLRPQLRPRTPRPRNPFDGVLLRGVLLHGQRDRCFYMQPCPWGCAAK
jgi:hypothetical protein